MKKRSFLLIILIAFMMQCTKQVTGTSDETLTGLAKVCMPDGTPAKGAVVSFFEITDTTRIPVLTTMTNAHGNYSIAGLAKSTYNIIAKKEGLVAYQDSVFILDSNTNQLKPDTLEPAGSISGIVGVQANDDPRTVTVQALGTDIFSNVDIHGWFTLAPIAKGTYTLRLVSTRPNYTPTFKAIKAASDSIDTLSDTLWLTYTGIPLVTGVKAGYDTLNGVVRISWDSSDYRFLREYLIYRDTIGVLQPSTTPYAVTKANNFIDSLQIDGEYSYRVAIRTNDLIAGPTFFEADIAVYSPMHLRTLFQQDTLTAYLNVPCSLHVTVSLWYGVAPKMTWSLGPKALLVDSGANPVILLDDTLTPDYQCVLKVEGVSGRTLIDTVHLPTALAWEKLADPLTNSVAMGIDFKSVVFNGKIYAFILTNTTWKEWSSADGVAWSKISDSLPFVEWTSKPVAFKGKMFMTDNKKKIGGSTDGISWNFQTIFSNDTSSVPTWLAGGLDTMWYIRMAPQGSNATDSCFLNQNGSDWVFQGFSPEVIWYYDEIVAINGWYWQSRPDFTDFLVWTGLSPLSMQPAGEPDFFNGKLISNNFAILNCQGGIALIGVLGNEMWYSKDRGVTWSSIGNEYPCLQKEDGTSSTMDTKKPHTCSVLNDHIYSISNQGVWRTR